MAASASSAFAASAPKRVWRTDATPTLVAVVGACVLALYFTQQEFSSPKQEFRQLRQQQVQHGVRAGYVATESTPSFLETAHRINPAWPRASASDPALVTIAADVFITGHCIYVVGVTECGREFDFTSLQLAIAVPLDSPPTCEGGSCPRAPARRTVLRPVAFQRMRVRSLWEWTSIAEYCDPVLLPTLGRDAGRVEVQLSLAPSGGAAALQSGVLSKRFFLPMRQAEAGAPIAMMVQFRTDLHLVPLWLEYWARMGAGHFYLYYNGPPSSLAPIEARLAAPPFSTLAARWKFRVTLLSWDYLMWQKGQYHAGAVSTDKKSCVGHYAQMMAFNDALHRFKLRHQYMGFFDFDEFLVLNSSHWRSAGEGAAGEGDGDDAGDSPILRVLRRYGNPPALSFPNRWGALLPAVDSSEERPLTADRALGGGSFYGAHSETGRSRSKFFVRCGGYDNDLMVGNHDIWRLQFNRTTPGGGMEVLTGNGYEREDNARATRAPPSVGYFLHVTNLRKKHQSNLPFDEERVLREMVQNRSVVEEVGWVLTGGDGGPTGTRAPADLGDGGAAG